MTRIRLTSLAALLALAGCARHSDGRLQGYIEGEFVYVASPRAGSLAQLGAVKGANVQRGDLLFVLDAMPEQTTRDEAQQKLKHANAAFEDAQKGKRPSELDSAVAALEQARAALALSEKEATRQEKLLATAGATTEHDVDRARASRDQDRQRVAELAAELDTARLGARVDQQAAAEADVQSSSAALARAEWELGQKRQLAPRAGAVFDTLYREGDWVAAGLPVVMLLPPENVKLRAFVAEDRIGAVHLGDGVEVFVDGVAGSSSGKISYISPRAEYTPPVVYSRENRTKFVFMIEAAFEPSVARELHPGQPVEVEFVPQRP
jgi:HlyD family secretion protein